MIHRASMRSTIAGLLLGAAGAARAGLPADGWPQARRDAALTGRSDEPALVDPVVAWTSQVGEALGGEPAAMGCAVYAGNGGGRVLRVNARSGDREWNALGSLATCRPPVAQPSSLALDRAGELHAGIAGDDGLLAFYEALCEILRGIESYAIDNNEYPPGPDLAAQLVPTYLSWPDNPCTGAPMIVTDSTSLGDARYERAAPDTFYLGGWWLDGGLVEGAHGCSQAPVGYTRLSPSWPPSLELGGGGFALDAASGAERWDLAPSILARLTAPSVLPDGVAWTQGRVPDWARSFGSGRFMVTDAAGATRWQVRRLASYIGNPAQDAVTGDLIVAIGALDYGSIFNLQARQLASGVESYSVDFSTFPPTAELRDLLIPTYLRAMPINVYTGETAAWSLTPSPGDYSYESLNGGLDYRLGMWSSDGVLVAVVESGVLTQPASGVSATVERRAASAGTLRWGASLAGAEDPTPLMLIPGAVVLGQGSAVIGLDPADGHELWRVETGHALSSAPALLPDGGIVFADASGALLAVDPGAAGAVRWAYPTAPLAAVAPTVTSDGVTYLGDLSGRLHAVRADGSVAWTRDLGGIAGAGLTTSAVPHEGWIYVGRSDGALVALAPPGWLPAELAGVLMARRTSSGDEAHLSWPDSPLPAVLGAHYHLLRSTGSPAGPWTQALAPHDFVAISWTDSTPGESLVFYTLTAADCGENESVGR